MAQRNEGVPQGFAPHYRHSPLTDPWEPIFSRTTDHAVILGLRLAERHCNGRGFAHGGLISALADNAMGLSCGRALGNAAGIASVSLVTVSLATDFLSSAEIGEWLEFDTSFVRPGKTLCFTQAFVTADGAPVARANAVFRIVARTAPREEKAAPV
jgi:acyl-coenzyme A thioesterase PaaI-like protein